MGAWDKRPLYRHIDVALLRAAAAPLTDAPDGWPDLADTDSCRQWLDRAWCRRDLAHAVRQASPSLGERVDAIRAGREAGDKRVRGATRSVVRYVLRSIGRPTPFGLFAGVAPVTLGPATDVRWGDDHRAVARVDTEWLADLIDRAERCHELLERLDVVVNDLAVGRAGRLELPQGPNRVSIRSTPAVAAVRDAAAIPIPFGALADRLSGAFAPDRSVVRGMLAELVRQGYLISCLRAPFTIVDPLGHVLDRLHHAGARTIAETAPLVRELEAVQAELFRHNDKMTTRAEQSAGRDRLTRRMRELSPAGRTPLAVDLQLDCQMRLPVEVVAEMERAAAALLRLTRQPSGEAAWRDYHAVFADRYGTGTLVPLAEVIDSDAGLGYPSGYRASVLPEPTQTITERDERLLGLAWQAMADGTREVTLTEELLSELTDERFDQRHIPPHVELAARVHAVSAEALDAGDFTLTVAPSRSAGILTSRFTPIATGCGLAQAYRALPCATEGALRAQLSFGPLYPHAENICRIPTYLDHVLPLGEHRKADDQTLLDLDDLAITATRNRLYLVSLSRRRMVEPQVFHALALDKQPPPLARFLAHLPRAFSAAWYQFDWGPHTRLPFLPRVRYRRTILSPAQWRLAASDLPLDQASEDAWRQVLDRRRDRWNCPEVVELRDADRTVRLTLDEPAHAALVRSHAARHGQAILYEATPVTEYGWIGGHAHEVALPLVRTRPAAPNPLRGCLPRVANTHGHLPGAPNTPWLSAKIHTHPERMSEIITEHLPSLVNVLDTQPAWWFVRYRGQAEPDHLRLRIRTGRGGYGARVAEVGEWARRLRHAGVLGRLVLDTYYPEIGRYGHGEAMSAAEEVFAADSVLVAAELRDLDATAWPTTVLAATSLVGVATAFLGDLAEAMDWLAARPVSSLPAVDRELSRQAIRLATNPGRLWESPAAPTVGRLWQARAEALAAYREQLPPDTDSDGVLESLLHMHHNRLVGIDPGSERMCRRLARQAAVTARARRPARSGR